MSIEQRAEILDEVIRRLVDEFRPERIYLFGSRARADHHEDSDYDLMMVLREPDKPTYERIVEAYRVVRDIGVPVDVLIWSREEFDRQAPVISSSQRQCCTKGNSSMLYSFKINS